MSSKNNRLKNKLTTVKTDTYRPSVSAYPSWYGTGWGAFNLSVIDSMRRDPAVVLALAYKKALLHIAEFDVQAQDPKVQQFVAETLQRFWQHGLAYALQCMDFGYTPAEVLYEEEDGLLRYHTLRWIHPRDAQPWTLKGKLQKIRIQSVKETSYCDLDAATDDRPAKGVWFVYDAQYNPWWGRSLLCSSWYPWRCKTMEDGASENLFKWSYKHAISCTTIRYPDVHFEGPMGLVHARDIAREMVQNVKAGGVITMPSTRDDKGNFHWLIEGWAEAKQGGNTIIEYVDHLDKQITRGVLVPDEIVAHTGSTGGYSRSQVSLSAFFIAAEMDLNHILEAFTDQVLRPLVWFNFGKGTKFVVKPKPLLPPEQGQQPPAAPGAAPGAPPDAGAPPGPGGPPGVPPEAGAAPGGAPDLASLMAPGGGPPGIDTGKFGKQLSLGAPVRLAVEAPKKVRNVAPPSLQPNPNASALAKPNAALPQQPKPAAPKPAAAPVPAAPAAQAQPPTSTAASPAPAAENPELPQASPWAEAHDHANYEYSAAAPANPAGWEAPEAAVDGKRGRSHWRKKKEGANPLAKEPAGEPGAGGGGSNLKTPDDPASGQVTGEGGSDMGPGHETGTSPDAPPPSKEVDEKAAAEHKQATGVAAQARAKNEPVPEHVVAQVVQTVPPETKTALEQAAAKIAAAGMEPKGVIGQDGAVGVAAVKDGKLVPEESVGMGGAAPTSASGAPTAPPPGQTATAAPQANRKAVEKAYHDASKAYDAAVSDGKVSEQERNRLQHKARLATEALYELNESQPEEGKAAAEAAKQAAAEKARNTPPTPAPKQATWDKADTIAGASDVSKKKLVDIQTKLRSHGFPDSAITYEKPTAQNRRGTWSVTPLDANGKPMKDKGLAVPAQDDDAPDEKAPGGATPASPAVNGQGQAGDKYDEHGNILEDHPWNEPATEHIAKTLASKPVPAINVPQAHNLHQQLAEGKFAKHGKELSGPEKFLQAVYDAGHVSTDAIEKTMGQIAQVQKSFPREQWPHVFKELQKEIPRAGKHRVELNRPASNTGDEVGHWEGEYERNAKAVGKTAAEVKAGKEEIQRFFQANPNAGGPKQRRAMEAILRDGKMPLWAEPKEKPEKPAKPVKAAKPVKLEPLPNPKAKTPAAAAQHWHGQVSEVLKSRGYDEATAANVAQQVAHFVEHVAPDKGLSPRKVQDIIGEVLDTKFKAGGQGVAPEPAPATQTPEEERSANWKEIAEGAAPRGTHRTDFGNRKQRLEAEKRERDRQGVEALGGEGHEPADHAQGVDWAAVVGKKANGEPTTPEPQYAQRFLELAAKRGHTAPADQKRAAEHLQQLAQQGLKGPALKDALNGILTKDFAKKEAAPPAVSPGKKPAAVRNQESVLKSIKQGHSVPQPPARPSPGKEAAFREHWAAAFAAKAHASGHDAAAALKDARRALTMHPELQGKPLVKALNQLLKKRYKPTDEARQKVQAKAGKVSPIAALTPEQVQQKVQKQPDGTAIVKHTGGVKKFPNAGAAHRWLAKSWNAARKKAKTAGVKLSLMPVDGLLELDARITAQAPFRLSLGHAYSCLLFELPATTATWVLDLAAAIDPDDLAPDGRETAPHLTLLYGITEDSPRRAARALFDWGPVKVRLGQMTLFQSAEHDVLKIDVEGDGLRQLNRYLRQELPHDETHSEYHPHITIAYLKPGHGFEYTGSHPLEHHLVEFDSVLFSNTDRKHTVLPLGEAGDEIDLSLGGARHAPRGGVTIKGTMFKGGQFIEPEYVAQATPEQLAKMTQPSLFGDDEVAEPEAEALPEVPVPEAAPVAPAPAQAADPLAEYHELGTRAPAFKAWFGDWENDQEHASKVMKDGEPAETHNIPGTGSVVTANGKPVVMYHGSQHAFNAFDKSRDAGNNLYGPGFYFTDDETVANGIWEQEHDYRAFATKEQAAAAAKNAPGMLQYIDPYKNDATGEWMAPVGYRKKLKTAGYAQKGILPVTDPKLQRAIADDLAGELARRGPGYLTSSERELAQRALERFAEGKPRWDGDTNTPKMRGNLENLASYIGGQPYNVNVMDAATRAGVNTFGHLYPVYLNIRNPIHVDRPMDVATADRLAKAIESIWKTGTRATGQTATEVLRSHGGNPDVTLEEALEDISNMVETTSDGPVLHHSLTKQHYQTLFKAAGYDGMTHVGGKHQGDHEHRVYIAFDPAQVKAVANAGTFDPTQDRFDLSTAHAPANGITIGGIPFAGGEFIPSHVLNYATNAEKAAVGATPANETEDHEAVLRTIPVGELGYASGFPVRRQAENQWRMETDKSYIEGDAATLSGAIAHRWGRQLVERRDAQQALDRLRDWAPPNVFTEPAREALERKGFDKLPKGARVVSLDPQTRGRLGTVEHVGKGKDKQVTVRLDGAGELHTGDVEPLLPKQSWRVPSAGKSKPKEAAPAGGGLFDAPPEVVPEEVVPEPTVKKDEGRRFYHVTKNGVGDIIRAEGFKVGDRPTELGPGIYLAVDREVFPTHLKKSSTGETFETESLEVKIDPSVKMFPMDSEAPNTPLQIYKGLYPKDYGERYDKDSRPRGPLYTAALKVNWPHLHDMLKAKGYGGIQRTTRNGDVGNTDVVVFDPKNLTVRPKDMETPAPSVEPAEPPAPADSLFGDDDRGGGLAPGSFVVPEPESGYASGFELKQRSSQGRLFSLGGSDALIEVPDVRQPDDYECGDSEAFAVGSYYGVGPKTLAAWKKALGTDVEKSTSPQAIAGYLAILGLQVEARQDMTLDDLAAYWRRGWPVIIPCQDYMAEMDSKASFDYGHWLVYIGGPTLGGYLFFQDSSADNVMRGSGSDAAKGKVMIEAERFLALWHDQGEDGRKYKHFGIAVGPPK